MNYASKTKDNLIKILDMKDREYTDILSSSITWAKENDDLKDQFEQSLKLVKEEDVTDSEGRPL